MNVNTAAAISTIQANQDVKNAVSIKTLKLAQEQQATAGDLVTAAAESAEQILSQEAGKGANLDVVA